MKFRRYTALLLSALMGLQALPALAYEESVSEEAPADAEILADPAEPAQVLVEEGLVDGDQFEEGQEIHPISLDGEDSILVDTPSGVEESDDTETVPSQDENDGEDVYGFEEGVFYSYKDGKPMSGWLYLDGEVYFLNEDGSPVTDQEKVIGSRTYRFDEVGRLVRGYVLAPGSNSFYSFLSGQKIDGIRFYNDAWWMMGTYTPNEEGLRSQYGVEYYQKANGSLLTNDSRVINGQTYYFGDNGLRVTSGPVNTPQGTVYLDASGNPVSQTDYILKQECQKVFDLVGTSLAAVFNWVASSISYAGDVSTKSMEEYALQGFLNRSGNCFTFASTFCYLASELGYSARLVKGSVLYTSGTTGEHGWVMINEGGKEYIYDPEAEWQIGSSANFFRQDPSRPSINYIYPSGQGPIG